jgi:hypothetical protein
MPFAKAFETVLTRADPWDGAKAEAVPTAEARSTIAVFMVNLKKRKSRLDKSTPMESRLVLHEQSTHLQEGIHLPQRFPA